MGSCASKEATGLPESLKDPGAPMAAAAAAPKAATAAPLAAPNPTPAAAGAPPPPPPPTPPPPPPHSQPTARPSPAAATAPATAPAAPPAPAPAPEQAKSSVRASIRKSLSVPEAAPSPPPATGPKKLTAAEVERFNAMADDEVASVSTSRPAVVGDSIAAKQRPYLIKTFSAPLGHPDHNAASLVADDKKASGGASSRFDPLNPHLAPPSALHRIATKWENHSMLTMVERAAVCRPTILSDSDYHPPLSSVSVQYPMGIVNSGHANGTGDAVRTASGLPCLSPKDSSAAKAEAKANASPAGAKVAEMKIKIGSSVQAQFEARRKHDEHPLRAMLRAHTVAPKQYKKGKKLLTATTPLNFGARSSSSAEATLSSSSSAGASSPSRSWPASPTVTNSSGIFSEEQKSIESGKAEERDRHRMATQSSTVKRNCMLITVPLDSTRNLGFK